MSIKLDILLIDDEPRMLLVLQDMLSSLPHRICSARNLTEAREILNKVEPEIVICDLRLGAESGLDFLREINNSPAKPQFLMLTAHGDVSTAVEAIKLGAFDFILKPTSEERLLHLVSLMVQKIEDSLAREILNDDLNQHVLGAQFVGNSSLVKKLKDEISIGAKSPRPVLIQGESGTGKELIARAVHRGGNRSNRPLVVVNCATLSKDLSESELFGHEKGSFTGAETRRRGKFELADKGTLFLDEIGELPMSVQPKLLRVLEDGSFERIGGETALKTDVKIIAATNRDLKAEVTAGRFRLDLLHRINTFVISVPTLHEREGDVLLLAKYFADQYACDAGRAPFIFSEDAKKYLTQYPWPGNVRELRNVVERGCATVVGEVLQSIHFGLTLDEVASSTSNSALVIKLEANERELILNALRNSNWVQAQAARELGLNRSHLHYKIKKLGIKLPELK